jgi:hypothetical protein
MNDGTYSVFFSTPVPEPGWAAAVLSGLWFTKRSRRRR